MKLTNEEINIATTVVALSVCLNPLIKQAEEELGEEEFRKLVKNKVNEMWKERINKKIAGYNVAGKIIKNISFFKGK